MGIFDRFPYSSTHEMNLDFMLGKATEIAESLQEIDTHKEQAEQAATNAAQSAQSAAQAAQAAAGSQTAAGTSASQAAQHKADAEDAADRAEAASNLADEAVEQAQAAATQAQTAATNAGTAADGAIASAAAAETRINNLAASLPEDFTELNNEVTDLKSALNVEKYTNVNSGHYITSAGNYGTSDAGRMSDIFSVQNGDRIIVDYDSGVAAGVGVIAKVNDSSYTVLVSNGESTANKHFEYKATETMNVVVSWTSFAGNVQIVKYGLINQSIDYSNVINMPEFAQKSDLPIQISNIPLIRENGYRTPTGGITGTTTAYFHSSFALQAGETIILTYKDVNTGVAILGYFDQQDTWTMVIRGTGGISLETVQFTAPSDITVSVSGGGNAFDVFTVLSVTVNETPYSLLENAIIQDVNKQINAMTPWQFALDEVLCIGDSLTKGTPPNTSTMPNPMKQNYPYYLGRMINTNITNAGYPGYETSRWYNECYSNYTMTDYNAFIICLGTNGNLTDTLETDVDPYTDYNDFAETQTGYYCKLIEHIKADNNNAIIVLCNIWSVASGADTTRTVIKKIAEKYTLPVVDTYDLRYAVNPAYHGNLDNVHLTKAGYLAFAHRICSTLKTYFETNKSAVNQGMTS